jgi:hypothetical protein
MTQTVFLVMEMFTDGCTFNNEVPVAAFIKQKTADGVAADMQRRSKSGRDFCVQPLPLYDNGDPSDIGKALSKQQ